MATPDESLGQSNDWSARTADTIESAVDALREKTVAPLIKITRAIVYGILALIGLLVVGILLSIAFIRLLEVYAFENRVWIAYLLVGGIMTVLGLLVWMKRTKHRK
jgi:hypothetical protein